jgi:predicted permease
MRALWQDVRYGLRVLGKNPGFTAVAVLTLALGIGANTALFSVLDALLFRTLAVKDPEQLVLVTDSKWDSFHYPLYERFCRSSHSFSGLLTAAPIDKRRLLVAGSGGQAEPIWAQAVSGNFFEVLGVPAVLGRTLTSADDRQDQPQAVAVISHGFWQRRFGLDPTVIGKTVILDGIPFTVVGVTPRNFFGCEVGKNPDLWWPLHMLGQVGRGYETEMLANTSSQWLQFMGRLSPAVPREQARAELDGIFRQMLTEAAEERRLSPTERERFLDHRIELQAGGVGWTSLRRAFEKPLFVLMGIAGLVLLIACVNVAGLLLARGAARWRELAVRAALGADRWTLARQLICESLLLALTGGALGLLLAQEGSRWLTGYPPAHGQTVFLHLTPDLHILAFTLLVSSITGILFGLVPALRSSRVDLVTSLKSEVGPTGGTSPQMLHKLMVVAQIALTCLLLVAAGLFVRTLQKLRTLDTGINRAKLLAFRLDFPEGDDRARQARAHEEVLRRLDGLPGVRSSSLAGWFSTAGGGTLHMPNIATAKGDEGVHCRGISVTPNYMRTLGISLVVGRDFGPEDLPTQGAGAKKRTQRRVILSESLARRLFGDANPVGRFLWESGRSESSMEVIGVARDVNHRRLKDQAWTMVFYRVDAENATATFYVRAQGNPLSLAGDIRRIVREVAPEAELADLTTMEEVVERQLFRERALSDLAGFFGLLALTLACLGLYGTLSYGVVRRTREIGVRRALGARTGNVVSAVIRQGMTLVCAGCAVGMLLAVALTRVVSSLLYGITPVDPLTFVSAPLLLGAVAWVACWFPARRAARIDPLVALRYE